MNEPREQSFLTGTSGPSSGFSPAEMPGSVPRLPPMIPDHVLLARVGRGAYGEVWLARSATGAYRAVKIVYRSSFEHDRPFEREFSGILKFEPISREHESQVDILHVGRGEGWFYYVMELADDQFTGQQIKPDSYAPKTLKSEVFHRGALPFEESVQISLALATALEHIHSRGLVHRDVKPSNIIFVNGVPKLADIGLVTGVDATRSYVGTEGFVAPEGPGTPQADLYSLGKVLYEMATGKDRQDFPELPTQVIRMPDGGELIELNAVIAKACRESPSERYQSAAAMRGDLGLLQGGKSVTRRRALERRAALAARVCLLVVCVGSLTEGALLFRNWLRSKDTEAHLGSPAYEIKAPVQRLDDTIPDLHTQFASLDEAIRSRIGQYARINVGREGGKCVFTQVLLNSRPIRWGNEYFDAVRFSTPPEQGLDMVWAFIAPPLKFSWQIMTDPRKGFGNFFSSPAKTYEDVPEPEGKILYLQGLPGQLLEPNRDYLIAFKFPRPKLVDVQVAVRFVPPGACSETNRASLETALGLIVKADSATPGAEVR